MRTFEEWFEQHPFQPSDPEAKDLARDAWEAAVEVHGGTVRDLLMIEHVLQELQEARRAFPENNHKLAALHEETGELAEALIERARESASNRDVYAEAVQSAAMAIRVAVDGDASFPTYHPRSGQNAYMRSVEHASE